MRYYQGVSSQLLKDFRLDGKAVILTDVDDTMLPMTQESPVEGLRSFLSELRVLGVEVVPVTFKTFIEVKELMSKLSHEFPAYVIEGGCAIYALRGFLRWGPGRMVGSYEFLELCNPISTYEELLTYIEESPDCSGKALRLSKAEPESVSRVLGIPTELIKLSQARLYSEVFITQHNPCRNFINSVIRNTSLKTIQTRRAVHILEVDKDRAARELLKRINVVGREILVIGLGDNPADEGILRNSDVPVVISENRVEWFKKAYYLRSPGKPPDSWIKAVKQALSVAGLYF
jgi:mannosyl-3-phosphoglycerate phosphatase family protein